MFPSPTCYGNDGNCENNTTIDFGNIDSGSTHQPLPVPLWVDQWMPNLYHVSRFQYHQLQQCRAWARKKLQVAAYQSPESDTDQRR